VDDALSFHSSEEAVILGEDAVAQLGVERG
jgi:hypothetical protein